LILKNSNVVPQLLLTGISGRHVVPELLACQLQRDYVALAEDAEQQRCPGVVAAPGAGRGAGSPAAV